MQDCFSHYRMLRKEMEAWLAQSRRMDPPGRHGGGEDEANYALAWFPHYLVLRGFLQWLQKCGLALSAVRGF